MSNRKPKPRLQIDEFSAHLRDIKPDVSSEDIRLAVQKGIASQPTISRYLDGEVKDTGVAYKLLTLFKKQIAKRAEALVK